MKPPTQTSSPLNNPPFKSRSRLKSLSIAGYKSIQEINNFEARDIKR